MGLSGLEPPTSRLSGVRSNLLSYKPPVENTRFELVTSCLQGRRSPNWAIPPKVLYNQNWLVLATSDVLTFYIIKIRLISVFGFQGTNLFDY